MSLHFSLHQFTYLSQMRLAFGRSALNEIEIIGDYDEFLVRGINRECSEQLLSNELDIARQSGQTHNC